MAKNNDVQASPSVPEKPEKPANQVPAMKNIEPNQKGNLRSVGQLLRDSWSIFAKGWVKYLVFSLLAVIAFIVLVFLFAIGLVAAIASHSWVFIAAVLVIGIPLIVILALVYGLSLLKIVYNVAEGSTDGIKGSLKYSLKHFASYFLVVLINGLIVVSPFLAVLLISIAVGFLGVGFGVTVIILAAILLIPALIVTIYFSIMLNLVAPAFVLEEKHNVAAIKRSWALVKGNFWPVFLRLLILFLIGTVFSSIQNSFSGENTQILMSLIMFVPSFILSYFSIGYTYLIYKDLAKNK